MNYSLRCYGGRLRVFKTRTFARLIRNTDISDQGLREAIERVVKGLVDAELGRGLVKQRVARQGQGRSGGGGYRTIIALRAGTASPKTIGRISAMLS